MAKARSSTNQRNAIGLKERAEELRALSLQAEGLAERGLALAEAAGEDPVLLAALRGWEKERKALLDSLFEILGSQQRKPAQATKRQPEALLAFARENWGLLAERIEKIHDAAPQAKKTAIAAGPDDAMALEAALRRMRWAHLDRTVLLWPLSMTTSGETWWMLDATTQTRLCWSLAWPSGQHGQKEFLRLRTEGAPLVLRRELTSGEEWEAELPDGVWIPSENS